MPVAPWLVPSDAASSDVWQRRLGTVVATSVVVVVDSAVVDVVSAVIVVAGAVVVTADVLDVVDGDVVDESSATVPAPLRSVEELHAVSRITVSRRRRTQQASHVPGPAGATRAGNQPGLRRSLGVTACDARR